MTVAATRKEGRCCCTKSFDRCTPDFSETLAKSVRSLASTRRRCLCQVLGTPQSAGRPCKTFLPSRALQNKEGISMGVLVTLLKQLTGVAAVIFRKCCDCAVESWEFRKIRGLTLDPKMGGLVFLRHPPPIYRNSQ